MSAILSDRQLVARVGKSDDEPIVRLEGVRKRYRQGQGFVNALDGVDLSVPRGSVQGVIGFSGAGKSTLLRCISRLETPDGGRVIVAGTDLAELRGEPLRRARRNIGVVFQQFYLLASRTVAGNIGLPLELEGRRKQEIHERVEELLAWFGIEEKAGQYPAQLSGGQKQRVAIARALALQPAVLLTDEPTSALDPETTASVLALLGRIRRDFGVTILLITHELDAVRAVCDSVAVLEAGRVVEQGPVEKVLLEPTSAAAKRLLRSELGLGGDWRGGADGQILLELQFIGPVASEPVMAELIRMHPVNVNILRGHIDQINQTPYGFLLASISGGELAVTRAIEWLRARGVGVTEAGR
jgi:D-methionine transport system ATP-binding protein